MAASPPPGRLPTPISSRTTPRPSGSTSCTARPARTPPSRRARAPSRYPAVSHEPRIQQLHDDLVRAGHRPFHLPVGIDLDESDPEAGRCIRCNRFDGFPCLTDGKADAHVLCVRPALTHPNVTLRTHARVVRLEPDSSGRSVKRVVVERRGAEEAYGADIVVVSCGAVNSSALLLRSASDRHPAGLANSSGVVGRHYMAHLNSAVIAISRTPNETRFQKTLGLNDYYWGADDSDFPLGHIQMLGKADADTLRTGAPRFVPGLALDYVARHSLDFWLTTEDLPHPDNRVTVDREGNIHLAKTQNNSEPHRRLLAKLKDLLGPLGCHRTMIPRWSVLSQQIPLAGIAHNCGTVRFGTDPKRSALDLNCKAHDLDNLYVVDASSLPADRRSCLSAPGARLRSAHASERCDRRSCGVLGQGAHRAAPAGGRRGDSAALPDPEAGCGRRSERASREHASRGPRRPRDRCARPPADGASAASRPAGDPLRHGRRSRRRVWRRREPLAGGEPGRGALAGLAIYAGTHGSLLPALGIQRPPWRLSPAAVAWESTSHLVFGAALEAARSALGGRR